MKKIITIVRVLGHGRHFHQFRIDNLSRLVEDGDQVARLPLVVGGKERVRRPRLRTPSCPADSVDVILGRVGVVVIDDVLDIFDVWKILNRIGESRRIRKSSVQGDDLNTSV